ncbi:MAG: class I SAM-dependent methyltransferase [Deltaproteobacteria bacterium]|uniref:Class I SAM-dependent methyltransferase n=1 Tax=Candidatus Zymogenus saltonus TaxID=2844893 RepID=A0A9D8KE91_9DELT|nr:class I SAM-dependent methyltransferase [Candidatus Zymogenus saltonus]
MEKTFSITDILRAYFSSLPEGVRAKFAIGERSDPESLAKGWEGALITDGEDGIIESFRYYRVLREISAEEELRLSYNDTEAGIYPFVVRSILDMFDEKRRDGLLKEAGCKSADGLVESMKESRSLRNSFRLTFLENIGGPVLSFLYSMVYLMGFSSGGEASFLTRVFPTVRGWKGHILDAGGGSGFAGLMIATRGKTTYIDFSPFRARRAAAVSDMSIRNERFFKDILDLIDLESDTFGLKLDRSLIPDLTGEIEGNLRHESGDLISLSKQLGPFDGAIVTDVLEHTTDPEGVLTEVANSLRPGAPLILTVPTEANGIGQRAMEYQSGLTFPFLLHIRFFSDEKIEKMAEKARLELVELNHFSHINDPPSDPIPMEVMALLRKR